MGFFRIEITHPDTESYISTLRINETGEWLAAYNQHSYTESVMECLGWTLQVLRHYPDDLLRYPLSWQESPDTFAREIFLNHFKDRIALMPHGPELLLSTVVIVF